MEPVGASIKRNVRVVADRDAWWLNLELLTPHPHEKEEEKEVISYGYIENKRQIEDHKPKSASRYVLLDCFDCEPNRGACIDARLSGDLIRSYRFHAKS